jgi:hypothetical protein
VNISKTANWPVRFGNLFWGWKRNRIFPNVRSWRLWFD